MITRLVKALKAAPREEHGSTLVMVTVFIVALFAFAALSIDISNVLEKQRRAHIGTDAGALAGAALLTNATQNAVAIINEATSVAGANGVTAAEIAAGTGGGVQVGFWNTNSLSFTANATGSDGRWNAVRVPARRNVPLLFGRVIGFGQMNPAVHSVAWLDSVSSPSCTKPFGVTSNILGVAAIGSTVTVSQKQGQSGQWGQLNLNGETGGGQNWAAYMLSNYCGSVSVGDTTAQTDPGADHVRRVMRELMHREEIFIMPILASIDLQGKQPVEIVGFVGVQVVDVQGGGANMVITLKIVSAITTGTGGGPPGSVFAKVRTLVE